MGAELVEGGDLHVGDDDCVEPEVIRNEWDDQIQEREKEVDRVAFLGDRKNYRVFLVCRL